MDINKVIRNSGSILNRVPFEVRYEVERLLARCAINRCVVGYHAPQFWNTLSELPKSYALKVLQRMHEMASQSSDGRIIAYSALTNAIHELTSSCSSQVGTSAVDAIAAHVAEVDKSTSTTEHGQLSSLSVVPNCTTAITSPGMVLAAKQMCEEGNEDAPTKLSRHLKIQRVMITSNRVISCPAESDLYNRVLHNFKEYREQLIRVNVTGEDGQPIAYSRSDDLFARVHQSLLEGSKLQVKSSYSSRTRHLNFAKAAHDFIIRTLPISHKMPTSPWRKRFDYDRGISSPKSPKSVPGSLDA